MTPVVLYCSSDGYEILKNIFPDISGQTDIKALVDFDTKMQGTYYMGKRITSPFSVLKKESFKYILIPAYLGDDVQSQEIINCLCDLGVDLNKIYWIPMEILMQDKTFCLGNCIKYDEYIVLDYLEYKVCDHCNLKCKGCSYFANIVDGEVFRDFNKFGSEINALKRLIPHIGKIRLLGGEPFLHPHILDFASSFREAYPYSDIRICTNGLLLENLKDEDFRILKLKNIGIDISCYPPLYEKIDSIVEKLKKENIFTYVEAKNRFKPVLLPNTVRKGQNSSGHCSDINLYNGEIFPCPIVITIGYYNKYFGTDFPENEYGIDLFDPSLTGKELLNRLNRTSKMCEYCANWRGDFREFLWSKSQKPNSGDWYPEEMLDWTRE